VKSPEKGSTRWIANYELMERRLYAYEHFREFLSVLHGRHTMRQIAHRSGLDHSTISRLLNSDRDPQLETAQAIIGAFLSASKGPPDDPE
jgi:DNA-binding phage protein